MTMDYTVLVPEIAGLAMTCFFAFYALKLLANFRQGMLERGWKQVAIGALFLIVAQFFFLPSSAANSALSVALTLTGMSMRLIAMILLILGLRAHYMVWRPDNKKVGVAAAPVEHSV